MFENTDFWIFAMLLLGLFFGWLPAFLTYRRRTVRERSLHRDELAYEWNQGWEMSKESHEADPYYIREVYQKYFDDNGKFKG